METTFYKLDEIIGRQLSKIRNKNKYSQEVLADVLGISQTTYGRYEAGIIHIGAALLYKIACFYKVDINLFFSTDNTHLSLNSELENEINRLKTVNEVLTRVNRQLIAGNQSLEDDFIRQMVEYIVNKQASI